MIDAKEYLEAGLAFHGHKCPVMPMGLRAGTVAMNRLGVKRAKDKELFALVELGDDHYAHCFADGIQMATGCTFGKARMQETPFFREFWMKRVPPSHVPDAVVEPLIRMVMGMSEELLLRVGELFCCDEGTPSQPSDSFVCDGCRETVVEKYGRFVAERKVCIPCREKLLAGE